MSVIIFLAVLFVLILVHEWGHFIVAKKTGMKVDEFGIGFPPRLYGFKKGETEYTLNAFPIGGFVKILGENSVDEGEVEDVGRSFTDKSKWAQAAVLVAGVTMNIIFAWILFVAIYMIGVPTTVDEASATDVAELVATDVLADSPAANAGLPIGAVINSVTVGDDTADNLTPSSFTAFTAEYSDMPLEIAYTASGEDGTVTLTAETGVLATEPDRPAVGLGLSMVEVVRESPLSAMTEATFVTADVLWAVTVGVTALIYDAFTLQADFSQVAGPVGIVGLVGDAAAFGFTSLLMFTAFISLNLAVINMLPFPALDGGRLLMVLVEAVIRRPINPVWVARLNFAGFALLILLMVAVTYSDVVKLI